jgi:conjugal transfer/entry exclusion protein
MARKTIRHSVLAVALGTSTPANAFVFIDPTNLIQNTISALESVQTTINTLNTYKQMVLDAERWIINMTGIPKAIRTFQSGNNLLGQVRSLLDGDAFWNQLIGTAWSSLYYPTPDRDGVHSRYAAVSDPQTVRAMEIYYHPYQTWQEDQMKVLEQYRDRKGTVEDYMAKSDEISQQLAALPDQESELATLQTAASAQVLTAQGVGAMRQDLNHLIWEVNKGRRLDEAQRMEALQRNFDDAEELRNLRVGYVSPKVFRDW